MRLRKGMVVAIDFLDHVEDSDRPLRCRVYGVIRSVARGHLVVVTWEVMDNKETKAANETRITIIRSAIVHVSHLVDA